MRSTWDIVFTDFFKIKNNKKIFLKRYIWINKKIPFNGIFVNFETLFEVEYANGSSLEMELNRDF